MKVNGPGKASGVSSTRKSTKTAATQAFSPSASSQQTDGASEIAPILGSEAIGSVDALLALQGADSAMESKRKATQRAFSMLDMLDDLKLALLEGTIPRETLIKLVETLKSHRDQTNDPKLESMLDEVELRAAVELAKLGN